MVVNYRVTVEICKQGGDEELAQRLNVMHNDYGWETVSVVPRQGPGHIYDVVYRKEVK